MCNFSIDKSLLHQLLIYCHGAERSSSSTSSLSCLERGSFAVYNKTVDGAVLSLQIELDQFPIEFNHLKCHFASIQSFVVFTLFEPIELDIRSSHTDARSVVTQINSLTGSTVIFKCTFAIFLKKILSCVLILSCVKREITFVPIDMHYICTLDLKENILLLSTTKI